MPPGRKEASPDLAALGMVLAIAARLPVEGARGLWRDPLTRTMLIEVKRWLPALMQKTLVYE